MDKVVEHSPVPWRIDPRLNMNCIRIKSGKVQVGEVYGTHGEDANNAAFIVKAVNHFALMLEVLKYVHTWMSSNRLDIEGANVYFQVKDTIDKVEGR